MTDAVTIRPAEVVDTIAGMLSDAHGYQPEGTDETKAFLAACSLLLALGAEPDIDPDDTSAAAEMVRELLLEGQVRTTTRSRRSV